MDTKLEIINAIENYEKSIAKIVLLCISDLEFGLGYNKISDILKGKQTKFITDNDLQNNCSYSLLKQFTRNEIKLVINILVSGEYIKECEIESRHGYIEILQISAKWQVFISEDIPLEVSFIDILTATEFVELNDEQTELYEKLRKIRYSISKEIDMPAYVICGEIQLMKMAVEKPNDKDDFLKIKGIGPVFVEKYSDSFLQVINKFLSNS